MLRLVTLPLLGLIVLLVSACADDEEAGLTGQPTSTNAPITSAANAPSDVPSITPIRTIFAAPVATITPNLTTPADWAAFSDADAFAEATFRYPSSWHAGRGGVRSSDPETWPTVCAPPGEMGIQASALPVEEVPRPDGATDYALNGHRGWELIEQNTEGCPGRAHTVVIEAGGLAYIMIFISDSANDEPLFQLILSTFQVSAAA